MWWVNATLQYYIRTRTRIPFGAMHDPALAARAHTLTQNHASHVHAQNTLTVQKRTYRPSESIQHTLVRVATVHYATPRHADGTVMYQEGTCNVGRTLCDTGMLKVPRVHMRSDRVHTVVCTRKVHLTHGA